MYRYYGKVVKVIDGDTLDVNVDLGFDIFYKIRVRLKDIDTPEVYHPHDDEELKSGRDAKQFVIDSILGKDVIIKTFKDKKGKYGRYIANIYYGDEYSKQLSYELKNAGFDKPAKWRNK